MKKFELKKAIKNEIKSVLSEDMNPEIYELRSRRVKATIDDLNQYLQNNVTASGLKSTLQDMIKFLDQFIFDDSLNEISSTEANAQLMEIVEYQKQILNVLKELKKGADLDAAIRIIENQVGKTLTKVKNLKQIKGLQTTFADIREDRLDEDSFEGMTPEDIKLYQDVQRLKHTGRTLDDEREAAERKKGLKEVEESDLDKVKAEIKKHLAMYQDAEGDMAKKSAVEMLKKLNVEKKRLEAEELENVSSIGMGQELDYDSED